METQELNRICELVESTVESWFDEQEDLTQLIREEVVGQIREDCEAHADLAIDCLYDYNAYALEGYHSGAVASRVNAFLNSEFCELSKVFSELYRQFNVRYFQNGLPDYRVKVMHCIPFPLRPFKAGQLCHRDILPSTLLIQYDGQPSNMIERLLHLMAHIRVRVRHDAPFQNALLEAQRMGAPSAEDPERYERERRAQDVEKPPRDTD